MEGPATLLGRIEVGGETVCVAAGIAALVLTWRAVPAPSLSLHGRARRYLLAALALFVLAELATLAREALLADLGTPTVLLSGLVLVTHEVFQIGFVACLGMGLRFVIRAEPEEVQKLRRSAEEDSLTSLHNRSFLEGTAQRMVEFSRRHGLPLSCVMVDIDDFKLFNDALGHAAGDTVLVGVADVLRRSTRPTDLVVRYGGEEFVVVSSRSVREAAALAERLRRGIKRRTIEAGDVLLPPVTASFGVANLTAEMEGAQQLLDAADSELYRAKRAGKNRVSVAADSADVACS